MVEYENWSDQARRNRVDRARIRLAEEMYTQEVKDHEYDCVKDYKKRPQRLSEKSRCYVTLIVSSVLLIVLVTLAIVYLWSPQFFCHSKKICMSEDCVNIASSVLLRMNTTADPCDNFYEYACGSFIQAPADAAKWSAFSSIYRNNVRLLKKLLESGKNSFNNEGNSTAILKLKTLYNNCMADSNDTRIAQNTHMINQIIESVVSWTLGNITSDIDFTNYNVETAVSTLTKQEISALFSFQINLDERNNSYYKLLLDQGGLSLPYESYTEVNHGPYTLYIETVFTILTGEKEASKLVANEVWEFEKSLSLAYVNKSERYDPFKVYNKMKISELREIFSNFDIDAYFENILKVKIDENEDIIVLAPQYFKKLNIILDDTPRSTIANYIAWKIISSYAHLLGEKIKSASFKFSKHLNGLSTSEAKWIVCVTRADEYMPLAMGALFVSERFSPRDKIKIELMLRIIREQFSRRIERLTWMDDVTKARARRKVNRLSQHIGYPEFIKSRRLLDKFYVKLSAVEGEEFLSSLNVRKFYFDLNIEKFRQKFTNYMWEMGPSEVNAYYSPEHNSIVFPAGILQESFYSFNYPMSMNYGGIGSVIGHELTHAFDNNGRLYDKDGNLYKWWTEHSSKEFNLKTRCFVDQYSQYKVGNGHINGDMTLGENIADNGGIAVSYQSYLKWANTNEDINALPGLDMLNNKQMFFLSFAQNWCSIYTRKYAALSLKVDVHSYAKYRAIGTLSNMKEFSEAFSCKTSKAMNPIDKCLIW